MRVPRASRLGAPRVTGRPRVGTYERVTGSELSDPTACSHPDAAPGTVALGGVGTGGALAALSVLTRAVTGHAQERRTPSQ